MNSRQNVARFYKKHRKTKAAILLLMLQRFWKAYTAKMLEKRKYMRYDTHMAFNFSHGVAISCSRFFCRKVIHFVRRR